MKVFIIIIGALAASAAARFSGELRVTMQTDDSRCRQFQPVVRDTNIERLICDPSRECSPNAGQIINGHTGCRISDQDPANAPYDFFVFPHDTVKFCRQGFCSCMGTTYVKTEPALGHDDMKVVIFSFNDDQAYTC